MAMPRDVVLVRHGHSEANAIQTLRHQDRAFQPPEGFHDRHDSLMRLSARGIQQALQTGEWLRSEFPEGFDAYFASPHIRTVETAGHLALGGAWNLDDRLRERDWGEFGILNEETRELKYALSSKLKGQNKWYWCPPGGESLATGVRLRYRNVLDTWHREHAEQQIIAVLHGETIDVAKFEHERLTPGQWLEQDKDPNYKVANCQVVQYSRVDPESGNLTDRLQWRRSVCVWDETQSWREGQWIKFERRRYTDQELLAMADLHPPLLND